MLFVILFRPQCVNDKHTVNSITILSVKLHYKGLSLNFMVKIKLGRGGGGGVGGLVTHYDLVMPYSDINLGQHRHS